MLGVHLSDNGISDCYKNDQEFLYDCLEPFQITEEDLVEINRSLKKETKVHPNQTKKYDKLDIDYRQVLDPIFKFDCYEETKGEPVLHKNERFRRLYKDRILLSKEMSKVKKI